MLIEEIDEPIDVIALFHGGKLRPIRFQWNGRTYPVKAVHSSWEDREGIHRRCFFSLAAAGSTYHIHLRTQDLLWVLDRVVLDG